MKKHIFILFSAILPFFIISCGTGPTGPSGLPGTGVIQVNFQNGVFPDTGYSGNTDNTIESANPTTNHYDDAFIYTGYDNSGWQKERVVMKFDLAAAIPPGAKIVDAYLTLRFSGIYNLTSIDAACYRITASWADLTSSWNSPWTTPGGAFDGAISNTLVVNTAGAGNFVSFKLSSAEVERWLNYPAENYGFMIKSSSETAGDASFVSSNGATEDDRPRLTVYYTAP